MAKIQRNTQKIFAGKGTNDPIAVFGSMKTGNPIYTDNIEDLQSTAYEKGWADAIVADEAPFLEEMNGVQYGFSKQLAYLFQEGIPEYDAGTTYYKGSIIKALNTDNKPVLYYSLVDDNLNNPLTDATKWEEITFNTSGGGFQPALFQPFISLTKLAHPSLVDSADYSWLNDGYVSAYNELVERYNTGENKYWYSNVNITGSLTNNQGILSGFSSANYATLPNSFAPSSSTWEMVFKINLTQPDQTNTIISPLAEEYQGFLFRITNNKFSIFLGTTGNSWDVANQAVGDFVFSANTNYYVKLAFNGTQYTASYSINGIEWITDITIENSNPIYLSQYLPSIGLNLHASSAYLKGSVNLNESYININGERWWTGVESYRYNEQYLMKIITPEQIEAAEAEFNATGQQPYFILDTTNTRFKLPRFKTIPQFTNDANNVGAYNEPAIPNAKGAIVAANAGIFSNATGVMTLDSPYNYKTAGTSGTGYLQVSFDLSRASSIYKDGVNTVQPPTTNFLLYFYLGESEIDDTSITGEVLEELNSKLDNDAGNLTDAGKEAIKSLLPQYTAGVIDSYENGYSWYRVYSDGFCEQGGYKSGSGTTTISLLRAYKNNNYTKTTGISGQNTAIYAPVVGVTNNNSSFSCYFNKRGTNYVYWRTAGFLPEGEY